jgi:hypothetical protein
MKHSSSMMYTVSSTYVVLLSLLLLLCFLPNTCSTETTTDTSCSTSTSTDTTTTKLVGITVSNVYSATWAVLQHSLFLYETIARTKHWTPVLLVEPFNAGDTKGIPQRRENADTIDSHMDLFGYTYQTRDIFDYQGIDTLIMSCGDVPLDIKSQHPHIHVVYFNQDAAYFLTIEELLENKDTGRLDPNIKVDTIWSTAHFLWQSDFVKMLFRADQVEPCPYVWSPRIMESHNVSFHYEKGTAGRIGVYETNRGFYKTSLIPMMIVENANEQVRVEYARILALGKLASDVFINQIKPRFKANWYGGIQMAELPKDWKEKRIGTLVSHTINIGLNNLWLEAIHAGMALVHNSEHMQECGYYYKETNVTDGGVALLRAMATHDDEDDKFGNGNGNGNERRKKDQACLWRFSINNPVNIEWFEQLLNKTVDVC